ncbi:MAG: hypothetical protein ACYC4L_03255 [Chloroflexota bacterium]
MTVPHKHDARLDRSRGRGDQFSAGVSPRQSTVGRAGDDGQAAGQGGLEPAALPAGRGSFIAARDKRARAAAAPRPGNGKAKAPAAEQRADGVAAVASGERGNSHPDLFWAREVLPHQAPAGQQKPAESELQRLGWLPIIAVATAFGLHVLAAADVAARGGQAWAGGLFWLGLLIVYLPVALRLLSPTVGRTEGLGLVTVLALATYLPRVMHSPQTFAFPDEFSHYRTADDILRTGQLFTDNPLLPVSALYPGLEVVTAALAQIGGLSAFHAGLLVVGMARLLMLVALFLVYEAVSHSARVAGIATALYVANPNYLFFTATFSYESLALPLALLAVLALLYRESTSGSTRRGVTAVALLVIGVVITTHHLTSYGLSVFLLGWLVIARLVPGGDRQSPRAVAIIAPVASLLWLVFVGSPVVGYIAPHVLNTLGELFGLLAGEAEAGRELFQSTEGYVAPLWEQLVGVASAGLILLSLPVGLILLWRRHRGRAAALMLALVAMAYPATLVLRLTGRGWEIGNRSSEFVFLGLAFVLALVVTATVRVNRPTPLTVVVALSVGLVFTGGVIAGWRPEWRVPAPNLQTYQADLVDAEARAAAEWANRNLGPGNRVATDPVHLMAMGSYGEQWVMTTLSGGIGASWVLNAPEFGSEQLRLLRKGEVAYVVIDRRRASDDPRANAYYPGVPLTQAYAKFDRSPLVSRVYDSGNVVIYDIRQLTAVGG